MTVNYEKLIAEALEILNKAEKRELYWDRGGFQKYNFMDDLRTVLEKKGDYRDELIHFLDIRTNIPKELLKERLTDELELIKRVVLEKTEL